MADTPSFVKTPYFSAGEVITANPNRDGSGALTLVATAQPGGTWINDLNFAATGDLNDCCVTVFLYDGTTYWYRGEVDAGNPVAPSPTVSPWTDVFVLNKVLPFGWSVYVGVTAAPATGAVDVTVDGGNLL